MRAGRKRLVVIGGVVALAIVGATAGRKEYAYTARPATGDAGLIRIERIHYGRNLVAGWIQLADGEQRGTQLAYVLTCGCYSGHRWCSNAYGVWHDFGPGSC